MFTDKSMFLFQVWLKISSQQHDLKSWCCFFFKNFNYLGKLVTNIYKKKVSKTLKSSKTLICVRKVNESSCKRQIIRSSKK